MGSGESRGSGFHGRPVAEGLEARVLLSEARELAVVGLTYDATDGFAPYFAELEWREDRTVTGDMYVPGATGPQGPTPTPLTDLINGPSGALRSFFSGDDFERAWGARVEPDSDYPGGWILGADGAGSLGEMAFVVERSVDVTAADLVGEWVFQFTRMTSTAVYTYHSIVSSSFNATGGFFALGRGANVTPPDPDYLGEAFQYVGASDRGRFNIVLASGGDQGVLFVSRDRSVVLFADLDERDGDTWMGVLLRPGVALERQDVAGSYRVGALAEGARTLSLLEGPTGSWRVDLDEDGSFEVFDLDAADSGSPGEAALTGTWTVSGSVATLTDAEGDVEVGLRLSSNGASAQLTHFRYLRDGLYERPMGFVTRIAPDADVDDTTLVSGIFDAEGRPLVFDLRLQGDAWSVVDLDRYALGDRLGAAPADIEAFAASDGRIIAMITTDEGLFAVERDGAGYWRASNLTAAVAGAENIVSTVTVFTDRRGVSHVAGLTGAGEVVTYTFDPGAQQGRGAWSYLNISDTHLTPQGEATPLFVGPLISYVTSWNGLNIAGLDADGNIRAVWSGNGGLEWHAANLTAITHAPPMTSGLTAYLTDWGGINIVGLNSGGRVVAAWWVPGFGGQWRQADLTTASQGPTLTGTSLTSFVAPWGALNVAGVDAEGDIVAYWWVPINEKNGLGWEWANLTAAIPADQPRPTEQLQSQTNTSHGGELNILGTDAATGDLLRLFWRVDDQSPWRAENVTAGADYA